MKKVYRVKTMTLREAAEINIFQHPNFHKSGSIKGMKKQFYGESALLVKCGDYIYNVPACVYDMAN